MSEEEAQSEEGGQSEEEVQSEESCTALSFSMKRSRKHSLHSGPQPEPVAAASPRRESQSGGTQAFQLHVLGL